MFTTIDEILANKHNDVLDFLINYSIYYKKINISTTHIINEFINSVFIDEFDELFYGSIINYNLN